jgi:hypothetical protein
VSGVVRTVTPAEGWTVVLVHRLGGDRLMRNSSPCAAKRVQTTTGWSVEVPRILDRVRRESKKLPLSCGYIRAILGLK